MISTFLCSLCRILGRQHLVRDQKLRPAHQREGDKRVCTVHLNSDGFTVYIANLKSYGKTAEIAANPKVELCYMSPSHDQVRITGIAEVLEDEGEIKAIWDSNALLRQYLGSADNPQLVIYRVKPERVRFMREWALEYHEIPLD